MVAVSVTYFSPEMLEGKILFQGDTQQGIAIGQEGKAFKDATGETTRWTNSLFGGMPNFQISPSYDNNNIIKFLEKVYRLGLPIPASYIFIMMMGFFILLLTLNVKWYLALIGAAAYAFSSYFFIIIAAGHIWKFITLAYIPPTIAGIILAYRGRYFAGAALAALFGMLQISANHIQMSYYFGIFILALMVSYAIEAGRKKEGDRFVKATASLVFAAILAVSANLPNIYNTYEYSKETMRGQSELVSPGEGGKEENSGGLSLEYMTHWSYGVGESWTLLIPDVKGGATGAMGNNSQAMSQTKPAMRQYVAQMNQYWGDQPFTAGPVYAGAVIMFLFLVGCFVVKGPLKWAALIAIALSLMLSWGHNFMPLTEWFANHVPLYNKFRTVSSILVVAEFCIPLLALLGLKEVIVNPAVIKERPRRIIIPFILTAGIALLFAVMPSLFFNFLSGEEVKFAAENRDYSELFTELESVRQGILASDAWRTFWFVAAAFGVSMLFVYNKLGKAATVCLLGVMVLLDMYPVNKRYLNGDNFVEKQITQNPFPPTKADLMILEDKDPNFRVLNLSTNTYDDPYTSYYHKSVGGYSAAKLRRYDDLIKYQLSKGNFHVINMLNTKYIITKDKDGEVVALHNPEAAGNAWLVSNVKWVKDASSEMNALDNFDEKNTVIIDEHFKELVPGKLSAPAAGDTIFLASYKPNELQYKVRSTDGGFAVFSEVYFPWGWHVTIDGKAVDMARVNYLLRGLQIPAGDHTIVFRFDPESLHVTTGIAYAAIVLVLLLCAGALYEAFRRKKSGA